MRKHSTHCVHTTKSVAKLPLMIGVACLLNLYGISLLITSQNSPNLTSQRGRIMLVGAAAALASLCLQTTADAQKFIMKNRNGADEPVLNGLWKFSRHPNYLCELSFHASILIACVSSCSTLPQVLLVAAGPACACAGSACDH